MRLSFRLLADGAILPSRAHGGDAGLDLHAISSGRIGPGERLPVGTGVAVEIPAGHAGLVLPRSGLARQHGVSLVNSPGLIDSGYRGEITILLFNNDPAETFRFVAGDRIAQLLVVPSPEFEPEATLELGDTDRGGGGFGSSGR